MGETRTSNPARHLLARTRALISGRLLERLRHATWASLISLAMSAVFLLEPLDQFWWLFQSRIADRDPSGDVVFVGSDQPLNDPDLSQQRYKVAAALDELDRRGVGKVFLDVTFTASNDPQADQRLARAIADLGPRITLVDHAVEGANADRVLRSTTLEIPNSVTRVLSDETDRHWFGNAWELHYSYNIDGKQFRSLGAAIAGVENDSNVPFSVDYGFNYQKIPTIPLDELIGKTQSATRTFPDVTGKAVVLGHTNQVTGSQQPIPGKYDAPAAFVDIYAGETLKAGYTAYLRGPVFLAIIAALLCIALILGNTRKRRWAAYAGVVAAVPVLLVLTARLGIRIDVSYALAFLVAFAVFRSRTRWKRRIELINSETGLPKIRALEARLVRENVMTGYVVIAKIQNYERVLKTLQANEKSSYVLKLVDRLRAADPKLVVYNDGHHLGWHVVNNDVEDVVEHLEGLRAIFAAPIKVGGFSVDVGITFGIASLEGDPPARLAAAVAAAEETSEAHNPIAIAETGTQTDLLWDISLRARIDQAMEVGEIYCVYQPKIDLKSKSLAGVEALVRWHDPSRGFISPMHFIQQCEKAGRMEHLTRYVLQSACSAGQLLHSRGRRITMAINISATLLGDMRIVSVVRTVLDATSFDPKFLVLEITETARITDYAAAGSVLEELRTIGVKISMDDFGVGAASFEAFYELPFDELKIDRLFVSNMAQNSKARAIVASVAAMGHEARITVVAEGLENPQDIGLLEAIGCQQVQGFAFSRPISLTNLLEYNEADLPKPAAKMV